MTETQLARKEENESLLIEHQERIFNVLPTEAKQRFMEVSLSVMNTPALRDCTKGSLFMSIWNCAKMGLIPDPNLGHVWIIPRKEKGKQIAQVQIGYRGRIELAQRSGRIASVTVHHWYGNDRVEEYEEGLNPVLRIKPWWYVKQPEPGPLMATYCVAHYSNGQNVLTVAPMHEIQKSKSRSKAAEKGFGPWKDDFDSMALIVPIRMAHRVWPQSPEMALAATLDRKFDSEEPQNTPQEAAEVLDGEELTEGMGDFGFKKEDEKE